MANNNKVMTDFNEAVADIPNGASIAMEGWGFPAAPQNLIAALKRKGVKDLTIICHVFIPMVWSEDEATMPSLLLPQMKKLISAVVGIRGLGAGNFVKEYIKTGLEVELTAFGTLASRLYAGAHALGGIYDPVGVGTILEKGRKKKVIDGKEYIFQKAIRPDYAFIVAHKADRAGNLVYKGYRSSLPLMAMAARETIVEVEKIVEIGEIDPEHVVTPGIFVDRLLEIPEWGLGTPQKGKDLIYKLSQIDGVRDMLFEHVEQPQAQDTTCDMKFDHVNGKPAPNVVRQ